MQKVYYPNESDRSHGCLVQPTAPFKGTCRHCGERTIVRNYPYSCNDRLGTFCKECNAAISAHLSCLSALED